MFQWLLIMCLNSMALLTLIPATHILAEDSARRLTNNEAHDYHCKWSPDGTSIAFTSWRTGEAKLFVIPASGGEATLIESGLSGDHHIGWSPDSKYLVFDANAPGDRPPRLWLVPVECGDVRPLVPEVVPAWQPALSPDGEWVVFATFRGGRSDVWKAKLNGDSLTQITDDPATDHHPQWSPDGNSIIFTSDRGGNWDVWMTNSDGAGGTRQITTFPESDDHAMFSPSGKLIAFMSEHSGKRDIWVIPVDGGPAGQVTHDGENSWPSFSPDSKYLVWSSNRDGQLDLYIGKIADD